jgi:hypothetical protein
MYVCQYPTTFQFFSNSASLLNNLLIVIVDYMSINYCGYHANQEYIYRQYLIRKFLIDIISLTLEIILIMQYSHMHILQGKTSLNSNMADPDWY